MTSRESARLARRRAVDEAAREVQRTGCRETWFYAKTEEEIVVWAVDEDVMQRLTAALALPRPWTTGRQRPQPPRHPRRMRKPSPLGICWCRRCREWMEAALEAERA